MNELMRIFEYHGARIRTYIDEDGSVWFCLRDVCAVLGISHAPTVAKDLEEEDKRTVVLNDGTPGNPNLLFVSETGFYEVLMRSRKPEVKPFRRWVTKDVLPSIRKHGGYLTDESKMNPVRMMRSLSPEERERVNAAVHRLELEEANQRFEEERRKRIESDEERRKADARAQAAISDNTNVMHNYRELERRYELSIERYRSVCKHMYKGLKEIEEREAEAESLRPDLLAQHDVEERVDKPESSRAARNRGIHDMLYMPPPGLKKDDEDES